MFHSSLDNKESSKIFREEDLASLLDQYLQKSELDMPFLLLLLVLSNTTAHLAPSALVFMKIGIKKM